MSLSSLPLDPISEILRLAFKRGCALQESRDKLKPSSEPIPPTDIKFQSTPLEESNAAAE